MLRYLFSFLASLAGRAGFACAVALGLGLAACETTPLPPAYPDLSYSNLAPIPLNVARIEVTSRYIPPMKKPNVEHLAPVPPYQAVRNWAEHRLRAAGATNSARMVILDASIREVPLKTEGGIMGALKRQQVARFDGRIAVMLEILAPSGRQRAFITVRSERSRTVPQGQTLAERDKVLFNLTKTMMDALNKRLEDGIRTQLKDYVVAG